RIRRSMSTVETRQEWEARQERVRRAWGAIGVNGRIPTSVGPYPLRLQVWHLAQEYAIHADDIEVPMSARDRQAQLRWRAAFGLFAAEEYGEPVEALLERDRVRLHRDGRDTELDLETFIAYLTNRPQQLKDAGSAPRYGGSLPKREYLCRHCGRRVFAERGVLTEVQLCRS